jgi:hypothetical protein
MNGQPFSSDIYPIMRSSPSDAYELLRHRLLILCRLVNGEKSVGALANFPGIRDSTASQHLTLLRRNHILSGLQRIDLKRYVGSLPSVLRWIKTETGWEAQINRRITRTRRQRQTTSYHSARCSHRLTTLPD